MSVSVPFTRFMCLSLCLCLCHVCLCVHNTLPRSPLTHSLTRTPPQILVLGDSGVGKTCLLTRFTRNAFDEAACATIGEGVWLGVGVGERVCVFNVRVMHVCARAFACVGA